MSDDLGNRLKIYEQQEAGRRLMPLLPVLVRIDGKSFSNFTKNFYRPYDFRLSNVMIETTKFLVEETNACIGYTQSDEISLCLYSNDFNSQIYFDGKIHKLVSVLASLTTVKFYSLITKEIPETVDKLPTFDCRVWNTPNQIEATNTFLWRELDATKNSISMAARHYYSHNQLRDKNGKEMQEMLFQKGINFNDYPNFFKRGTFIQRRIIKRRFTAEEIQKLPVKHQARANPDLEVERTEYHTLDMPPFAKVINRVDVIFAGAEPEIYK